MVAGMRRSFSFKFWRPHGRPYTTWGGQNGLGEGSSGAAGPHGPEPGRTTGQLGERDAAGPLQFDDAERLEQVAHGVELARRPRDHDRQRVVADVVDLG